MQLNCKKVIFTNIYITTLALNCFAFNSPSWAAESLADIANDIANNSWQRGFIAHMQKMRMFRDSDVGAQPTPPVIPKFELDFNASGFLATYQPGGPTTTATNAFFKDLGTNQRTCFTCHQPQGGWSVSAQGVQARFYASFGTDPIFRLVDGAICPTADVSTIDAKLKSYGLLLSKGLIRVGLPIPADPVISEFEIADVQDTPYNCNKNSATGLTSPRSGIVSIYRRPLPSTNLKFLSTIMWDGREPSLASQANNATLAHAEATAPIDDNQKQQIVAFESGLFTAQLVDYKAKELNAKGATGGPWILAKQPFFIGINDPFGQNPENIPFTSKIFNLYDAWKSLAGDAAKAPNQASLVAWMTPGGDTYADRYRASVARGQELFNNTPITISGVAGINDVTNGPLQGFCGTCHDAPNVGSHSVTSPMNIGVANAGTDSPPGLDISGLPVFTIQCVLGPLKGKSFVVTDPGRALISGKCADIGKFKAPILRGLAGRAPYFHNGSAATLLDVIKFYDDRFDIGFTDQQMNDLEAFLRTL
jgi:cytochrome c peroxidase